MTEQRNDMNRYIQGFDVGGELELSLSQQPPHSYIDPSISSLQSQPQPQSQSQSHQLAQQTQNQSQTHQSTNNHGNSDSISNNNDSTGLTPDLPPGSDPKKTCPFCHRTFSHYGSLGRHLDLKKGSKLHPFDIIDKMRADVNRRGDAEKVKQRRRLKAKIYNAREDIKQRNRIKRKERDGLLKKKNTKMKELYYNLGYPKVSVTESFCYYLIYFLKPAEWSDNLPDENSLQLLLSVISNIFSSDVSYLSQLTQSVHKSYEAWNKLPEHQKLILYLQEFKNSMKIVLNNTTMFELSMRTRVNTDNNNNNESNHNNENNEMVYNHAELEAVAQAVNSL